MGIGTKKGRRCGGLNRPGPFHNRHVPFCFSSLPDDLLSNESVYICHAYNLFNVLVKHRDFSCGGFLVLSCLWENTFGATFLKSDSPPGCFFFFSFFFIWLPFIIQIDLVTLWFVKMVYGTDAGGEQEGRLWLAQPPHPLNTKQMCSGCEKTFHKNSSGKRLSSYLMIFCYRFSLTDSFLVLGVQWYHIVYLGYLGQICHISIRGILEVSLIDVCALNCVCLFKKK